MAQAGPAAPSPIILGGAAGPRTIEHIVEFCDGHMPIGGRTDLVSQIEQVRRAATGAGRDPATIEFGQFGTRADPATIEKLVAAGCSRLVFGLPPAGRDEVLPLLDRHAELAASFA